MPAQRKLDLSKALGFVVNRTAYLLRVLARETLLENSIDLTPEELALLVHLWQRDGQTQGELAACAIRDRTTVTRILDRMSTKGLIRREPGVRDRRRVRTWLTREGKKLEQVILPKAARRLAEITRGIPETNMKITLESLRKVQENIQATREAGGEKSAKPRK
jgi:DNA-binding MarR family transcriptional regulator